jgi:hypothetical protein
MIKADLDSDIEFFLGLFGEVEACVRLENLTGLFITFVGTIGRVVAHPFCYLVAMS